MVIILQILNENRIKSNPDFEKIEISKRETNCITNDLPNDFKEKETLFGTEFSENKNTKLLNGNHDSTT